MPNIKASDLVDLIRNKFSPPAWAFFSNVANGTGFSVSRYADAMAMGIWPSRGLELHGFEVKISRTDWIKELRNPQKADDMIYYCDFWWVVVPDEKIIQHGELPINWGLFVKTARGLKAKVPATKLEANPLDRIFIASLLRRAQESMVFKSEIESIIQDTRQREIDRKNYDLKQVKGELESWKESVSDFEKASGVKIQRWNGEMIGDAVRQVLDARFEDPIRRLKWIRKQVGELKKSLDNIIETPIANPTPGEEEEG